MSLTLTAPPAPEAARLRRAVTASAPRRERPPRTARTRADIVEVWGRDSFPASDPPANW